jgi:hypothetical protein
MFNFCVSLVGACEKNVRRGGGRSAVQLARLPRLPHIYQPLLAAVLVVHPEIVGAFFLNPLLELSIYMLSYRK